jgi:hypothetical protein
MMQARRSDISDTSFSAVCWVADTPQWLAAVNTIVIPQV